MIDLKELLKAGCGGVHLNPSYVRHWRYIYIYIWREREREREIVRSCMAKSGTENSGPVISCNFHLTIDI
jgi:RNase P/RNase MRP subunit POP5